MTTIDPSFARGLILKVAFKPEALRRAQAFLLYVALSNQELTGDCIPNEIHGGEPDNTLAGIAIGSLATAKLIERCGRCKSPSPTRNGAWVNVWRLDPTKRYTALTWLERNGFPKPDPVQQTLCLA